MEILANNPISCISSIEVWLFLKKNLAVCINTISKAFANGLLTFIDHDLGIQSLIILKTTHVSCVLEKSLPEINQFFEHTIRNYQVVIEIACTLKYIWY